MPAKDQEHSDWYEVAFRAREEALAALFGPTSPPDQVIKSDDEGWEMTIPGFAFLQFPPSSERDYWLYVSDGLSQPQSQQDFDKGSRGKTTGFGVEFAISTPAEETWPITMLDLVCRYVVGSSKPLLLLHRIPASDLMEESPGGHLLAMETPGYETNVTTPNGVFDIFHLVGITSSEVKRAKEYPGVTGSKLLECVLHHSGIGCVTDRRRSCLTSGSDFSDLWRACEEEN